MLATIGHGVQHHANFPPVQVRAACLFSVVLALAPTAAAAQGLSARFGWVRAVEKQPLVVRVEIDGLLELVGRVRVEAKREGYETWSAADAVPIDTNGMYEATFTSTIVANAPGKMEIRARIIGTREGVLLELGDDEPLVVEVLSAPEAKKQAELFAPLRREGEESDLGLIGWVGVEGRAGTSARIRASIGLGLRVSKYSEALIHVTVGPAFSRPKLLEDGGPVVLGIEGGYRVFTKDVRLELWSPFLEVAAGADLRLPGVDPLVGLRAGLTLNASADVAVDVSLGGAFIVYRAIDPEDRSSVGGFTGGLRLEARFGGGR